MAMVGVARMEDPEAGGAGRSGSRPPAAVFNDRVRAQRIADCGDYRMAEVMPTNCLWRASRGFALYDLGEDGVKCVVPCLLSPVPLLSLLPAGEGSGRQRSGEQQQ
jgi:hypothetical protein